MGAGQTSGRHGKRGIVVLTGAGVSAESGLGTFRGRSGSDEDGMWTHFDPMKLATPEAFARDPDAVHAFYNARRRNLLAASPNDAHVALARLETGLSERGDELTLITQNVDDLHERAGHRRVLHMRGELLKVRCLACGAISPWRDDLGGHSDCPACDQTGRLRPHVVWFGEMPLHLPAIETALADADLFVAIGTSGYVYPAAGFVTIARQNGVRTCELNLELSDTHYLFDERRSGAATDIVPGWVTEVLAGSG